MQDFRLELLRSKMDELFKQKDNLELKGKNINNGIQGGREYRNPRINEKLIELCNIKQYGTNFASAAKTSTSTTVSKSESRSSSYSHSSRAKKH